MWRAVADTARICAIQFEEAAMKKESKSARLAEYPVEACTARSLSFGFPPLLNWL